MPGTATGQKIPKAMNHFSKKSDWFAQHNPPPAPLPIDWEKISAKRKGTDPVKKSVGVCGSFTEKTGKS
jgi:hypothetical protein